MSEDALKAQIGLHTTDIAREMGRHYVNAPLVLQTVGMPCQAMLEHPTERMAHWLKVEREKHHAGAVK